MTRRKDQIMETLPLPSTPDKPRSKTTVRVGISLAIMIFMISVGLGILWVILFQAPANDLLDIAANQTTNTEHAEGVTYVRSFVDNFLFISVGFGAFTLIVDSAFERGGT